MVDLILKEVIQDTILFVCVDPGAGNEILVSLTFSVLSEYLHSPSFLDFPFRCIEARLAPKPLNVLLDGGLIGTVLLTRLDDLCDQCVQTLHQICLQAAVAKGLKYATVLVNGVWMLIFKASFGLGELTIGPDAKRDVRANQHVCIEHFIDLGLEIKLTVDRASELAPANFI